MRQSSGLVKKGKYVRALLDHLARGPETCSGLDSYGDCGPNSDYIMTNLNKLVESGEIVRKAVKGSDATYHLNTEWTVEDKPSEFTLDQEPPQDEITAFGGKVSKPRGMPNHGGRGSSQGIVRMVSEEEIAARSTPQVSYEPTLVREIVKGERLTRNKNMETFLGVCFLNEVPNWEGATKYYVSIHKAKYSVVDHKGKVGERLEFEDD